MRHLDPSSDVAAVRAALLDNYFICIQEVDADLVAEWAKCPKGGLLVIGPTGSGKTVLVQTLQPVFENPAHWVGRIKDIPKLDWPRPLIIDETVLGLGHRKPELKWQANMIEALNACRVPMLVTAYRDLDLEGEWLRVELDIRHRRAEAA
jgi:hypothetical protein